MREAQQRTIRDPLHVHCITGDSLGQGDSVRTYEIGGFRFDSMKRQLRDAEGKLLDLAFQKTIDVFVNEFLWLAEKVVEEKVAV